MHPPKHVASLPNMSGLDTNNTIGNGTTRDPAQLSLCGYAWHADYAAMHARAAKILHSVSSEEWNTTRLEEEGLRVFIYIAREGTWEKLKSGGVGDRFSLVSMLAMSLAHHTAFFIDYPGLKEAFDSGAGGLSWAVDASGYIERHGYRQTVLHFPDLRGTTHSCTMGNNEGHLCRDLTLDRHIANRTFTIARTARGKITVMFNEQEVYYRNILKQMGLEHGT